MKRQFKVRLVEKSLPNNAESEAVATAATSTQMPVVKETTTTAKPSPIPMMVYNLDKSKIQEILNPTRLVQEEENPFTPNHSNPPMVQQSKATTTATSTAHQPEMTLHGQILCQPPPICLLQGHHGQLPLM